MATRHATMTSDHVRCEDLDPVRQTWALGESRQLAMLDGARVAVRRSGRPGAPVVLLGHGNGFAVDAFGTLARLLECEHELFRMDLRNHGRSALGDLAAHVPASHVSDLGAVMRAVRAAVCGSPVHGVFHSISGVFAVELALQHPDAFASLTLMEPPLALPPCEPLAARQAARQVELAASTRRRRDRFACPRAFAERLRGRAPFHVLDDAALAAYARAVLRREPDGSYHLACPPDFEAALYASNVDRGLFDRLPSLGIPGTVLAGTADPLRSGTAARIAAMAGFQCVPLEGLSHLMPMEGPRQVARAAARQVAGAVR